MQHALRRRQQVPDFVESQGRDSIMMRGFVKLGHLPVDEVNGGGSRSDRPGNAKIAAGHDAPGNIDYLGGPAEQTAPEIGWLSASASYSSTASRAATDIPCPYIGLKLEIASPKTTNPSGNRFSFS